MTLPVAIRGTNPRNKAITETQVTPQGALVSAPYDFDLVSSQSCVVANTAYNMFSPRAGYQFVSTAIKVRGSKDVSNTVDATVVIYEANSTTSTTIKRTVFSELIVRFESTTLAPVNILINEGCFINAKTTEATVTVTMTGYFVPNNQEVNT